MLLRVTIDIFSGRDNPVVELRDEEAKEAIKRLKPKQKLSRAAALPPTFMLGYRGLFVEQVEESTDILPSSFRLVHGDLFGTKLAHRVADDTFEEYIFDAADLRALGLEDGFKQTLKTEMESSREARRNLMRMPVIAPIKGPIGPILRGPLEENKIAPCAPLYEPAWWNDGGQRQLHNNCYNYSTNYRTDTFRVVSGGGQPGAAAGAMYASITSAAVKAAAIADGLEDAPNANNLPPVEGHLVALVIWPGFDFHWFRMNRNCSWSHKPGSTPVTNVDNSGAKITDPRSANRGSYTEFTTFMVVKHGHIKVK